MRVCVNETANMRCANRSYTIRCEPKFVNFCANTKGIVRLVYLYSAQVCGKLIYRMP